MHLVVALVNRADHPEKAIHRLRHFGVNEPLLLRARSTAAALSTEVPVFAGLRSLAIGADEDRLIMIAPKAFPSTEEAERWVSRVQLEMDADQPPSGRIFAIPMISAART